MGILTTIFMLAVIVYLAFRIWNFIKESKSVRGRGEIAPAPKDEV